MRMIAVGGVRRTGRGRGETGRAVVRENAWPKRDVWPGRGGEGREEGVEKRMQERGGGAGGSVVKRAETIAWIAIIRSICNDRIDTPAQAPARQGTGSSGELAGCWGGWRWGACADGGGGGDGDDSDNDEQHNAHNGGRMGTRTIKGVVCVRGGDKSRGERLCRRAS